MYTELYVWGTNHAAQLPFKQEHNYIPQIIQIPLNITAISCGEDHIILQSTANQLYSLGTNTYGVLGINQKDPNYQCLQPTLITKLSNSNVVKVRSGWNHSIAILDNGVVYSWGRGDYGQLGNQLMKNNFEPEIIDVTYNSKSYPCNEAACGVRHTIFITNTGMGLGCGSNDQGQLGIGNKASQIYVQKVLLNKQIKKAACGPTHTLFLTQEQECFVSGSNSLNQLGLGKAIKYADQPKLLMRNVNEIAAGNHSALISNQNRLYIWGRGTFGNYDQPTQFSQILFKKISIGGSSALGLDACGNIHSWGSNSEGQLGLGDYNDRQIPSSIQGLPPAYEIQMGLGFGIGIGKNKEEKKRIKKSQEVSMRSEQSYENLSSSIINFELKSKIDQLIDGQDGVKQKEIQLKEKGEQIQLLNQRIADLNELVEDQNQELSRVRQARYEQEQQVQSQKGSMDELRQEVDKLRKKLKQMEQEQDFKEGENVVLKEQLKNWRFQEKEAKKQLQHQIEQISVSLEYQQEIHEKLSNTLQNEKINNQKLQQELERQNEQVHQLDMRNKLMKSQLNEQMKQNKELKQENREQEIRMQNSNKQNEQLRKELEIIRDSLYGNEDQQRVIEYLEQQNYELNEQNNQKDLLIQQLKSRNNNEMMNMNNNSISKSIKSFQKPIMDSAQKEVQYHYSNIEQNKQASPPRSISQLIESAQKNAKIMNKILNEQQTNGSPTRQLNFDNDIEQKNRMESGSKQKAKIKEIYQNIAEHVDNDYSKSLSEVKAKLARFNNRK